MQKAETCGSYLKNNKEIVMLYGKKIGIFLEIVKLYLNFPSGLSSSVKGDFYFTFLTKPKTQRRSHFSF